MRLSFERKTWQHIGRALAIRWKRWQHAIFFVVLIAVLIGGGVLWHWSLYLFRWTEGERTAYINGKIQSVQLNEGRFEKVIRMLEKRQAEFGTVEKDGRDIFRHE